MVTHSKEKALDRYGFEHFVDAARRLDNSHYRCQATFVAFVAGRLGLRSGEICHIQEDWIDWRNRMIDIPYHEPCQKGKDGGRCGHCKQQARQKSDNSQISLAEARLEAIQKQLADVPALPGELQQQLQMAHLVHIDSDLSKEALDRQVEELLRNATVVDDVEEVRGAIDQVARNYQAEVEESTEEVLDDAWTAKTVNAERSVPFDWCPRAEIAIETFFELYDSWPLSISGIKRRVNWCLEDAQTLDENSTVPHGLRATAATHVAGRGLSAPALQAMFGWSQISTAQAYIASSPDNTQTQLNSLA